LEGHEQRRATVARIEADGQDVNLAMVAAGLAWHFTRSSDDRALAEAESDARAAGRGLWADREPVPPWEWRAAEKGQKRAGER
jgi:endonuclease YncB( thermonuclease family)